MVTHTLPSALAGAVSAFQPVSLGVEEFQLKAPLDPAKYEALWLRLNRPKGLELISTKKEPQP